MGQATASPIFRPKNREEKSEMKKIGLVFLMFFSVSVFATVVSGTVVEVVVFSGTVPVLTVSVAVVFSGVTEFVFAVSVAVVVVSAGAETVEVLAGGVVDSVLVSILISAGAVLEAMVSVLTPVAVLTSSYAALSSDLR